MCVFCAAVPVAMVIGTSVHTSQQEKVKLAEEEGKTPPRRMIPVRRVTAVVIGGLVIFSFVYHTQFGGVI
ncbi:MAG TPA: hypothetical protein VF313_11540 [Anaerolineaceae bacterium]